MKIFVFAYNRFETMSTSWMLTAEGIEHCVLCHSAEDLQRFISGGTAEARRIVATGNPRGLTRQRNFALGSMADGEWGLFLNDDLERVTRLHPYYDSGWTRIDITKRNITKVAQAFDHEITLCEFVERCEAITQECDRRGVHLGGFVAHGNAMFRGKKITTHGLVDGRAWLVKKQAGVLFDENVGVIEDHEWTARNLERDGEVYVDNWICPEFKRMTAGGFGTIKDRTPELRHDCAYLIGKYPDVFEYKEKAGYPSHTQLKFKRIF